MKRYGFFIAIVIMVCLATSFMVFLFIDSSTDFSVPRQETSYEKLEKVFGIHSKVQCFEGRFGEFCETIDAPIPADALRREFANLDGCVQDAVREHLRVGQSPLTIGNVESMGKACEKDKAAKKSKADAAVLRQAQKQVIENLPTR